MEKHQDLFDNIDAYLNGELKGERLKAFEDALKIDDGLRLEVEKQNEVQQLYETIGDYLNSRLEGEDLKTFQDKLKTDKALQEEVEKHQLIQNALKDKESIDFRKKLMQMDAELKESKTEEKPVKKMPWRYWKVAATVLILLGLSSLLYFQNQNSQTENLFASYYTPYPMGDLTRGEYQFTAKDSILKELAQYYNNKNYQKVIGILKDKIKTNPDDQLKLYLGNSYLNVSQENKAIAIFQSIHEESQFYSDAQWFLALTHVRNGDKINALSILEKLSTSTNLYTGKAFQLKEVLK